jgi:hypothetical protein
VLLQTGGWSALVSTRADTAAAVRTARATATVTEVAAGADAVCGPGPIVVTRAGCGGIVSSETAGTTNLGQEWQVQQQRQGQPPREALVNPKRKTVIVCPSVAEGTELAEAVRTIAATAGNTAKV